MANAVTHQNPLRKAVADLVVGNTSTADWNSGSNQKLVLYSGSMPANATAALSGNTACSTITSIVWTSPASSSGVATIASSSSDTNAVGGTVTFFRLYRTAASDPSDVILQGTVGTSGSDLNINSTVISAGATVTLSSGTYTAPV
jgi:hypothetical protein